VRTVHQTTAKAVRPPQRSGSTAATTIRHTGGPNPGRGPLVLPGGTPVPDAALKRDMDGHDTNLRSGLRAHSVRCMMTGGGQPDDSELDMPKLSEREKLADLEARQRKMVEEVTQARSALRDRYAAMVRDIGIEALTEREFRDLLTHAIRVGGAASVGTLKALPTPRAA